MATPERRFERDRDHLVGLLASLLDRIENRQGHPEALDLCPLFAEIEDLELAERCGLPGPPFVCSRERVNGRVVDCYLWLDPYDRSKPRVVSRGIQGKGERYADRLEEKAREDLKPAISLWFETVHSLDTPAAYTADRGPQLPGRDPVLFHDRLWRMLSSALSSHSQGSTDLALLWSQSSGLPQFMRKLNAMARYEGLVTDDLFRLRRVVDSKRGALAVDALSALAPTHLSIDFTAGIPPDPQGCEKLCRVLREWIAVRAAQLRPGRAGADQPPDRERGQVTSVVKSGDPEIGALFDLLVKEGNSEAFNGLKPSHRKALDGFRVACEQSTKLDRHLVTREHHAWLCSHMPSLLEGTARKNAGTWITYVRQGTAMLFGPKRNRVGVPTRSVVNPGEADFRRKPRG